MLAPPPRARLVRPLSLALLLLATCTGCERTPVREPSARRLAWEVAQGEWPAGGVARADVLEVPAELGGAWTVSPPELARVDRDVVDGMSGRVLVLESRGGPVRVRIDLERGVGRFDLLRVPVYPSGYVRLVTQVARAGGSIVHSDVLEVKDLDGPEVLEFDLSGLMDGGGEARTLVLNFQQSTRYTVLGAVELLRRSRGERLPSPLEEATHVQVGSGSRRAVGLLPEIVLEAPIPAAAEGRVSVAATLPPGVEGDGDSVTLALVRGDDVLRERTVDPTSGWEDHELGLEELDVGAGGLRVRVTTDAPRGALVGVPLLLAPAERAESDPPRTVLLLTSDTHRADHVGYAADGVGVETPAIDAIAARGTRFEDVTAATSVTNPSHASMFTGLSVKDTGVVGNLVPLSHRADTLAERFEAAGFRTFAATSARHMTPWRSGFGQGFERFDAPRTWMWRKGDETIAIARRMLEDAEDHDVFLWLHLFDAHGPYLDHECCTDRYYDGDPYDPRLPELPKDARPRWDGEIRDEDYVRALYKSEVTYLDTLVGSFFEQEPRFSEGWIAITADHGESLGEQGLFWTHTAIYPSTLRVPLVLAGPGVPEGEVVERPVSNVDVARTLLEAAGVAGAEDFPGASLLGSRRPTADADEPRFVVGANALSAGVLHEGWYLLLHLREKYWGNPAPSELHAVELYDLAQDPDAAVNVADRHPNRTRRMRSALVRWLETPPAKGLLAGEETTSANALSDVEALGYAADESSTIDGGLIDPDCDCAQCERWR